jgi:hypothetical protein
MLPDDKEDEMVLACLQRDKACTENQLVESLPIDKPAVRRALARLVLKGEIIWVGALPKSGVFFKPIAESGFGFNLRKTSGAHESTARVTSKKIQEIREFIHGEGSVRVTDVVERFPEISRVSAFRVLKRLQKEGALESMVWKEPRQMGRPPRIWAEPGFLDEYRQSQSHSNPMPKQMPEEDDRDAPGRTVVEVPDDLPFLD